MTVFRMTKMNDENVRILFFYNKISSNGTVERILITIFQLSLCAEFV